MDEMALNMSVKFHKTDFNFTNVGVYPLEYVFQDLRDCAQSIAFTLIILGSGVFLRTLCNVLKRRFLYYPMMLLMGFFIGLVIHYKEDADVYNVRLLEKINPNNYMLIFFPVMLFHTAFSMDYHGFGHSTLQVLFVSVIGFPVQAMILALIFSPTVGLIDDWTWEVAITFSITCYIIESDIVFFELSKTHERVKHILLLLQGEQLATLAAATYAFRVNFEHYYGETDTTSFVFLTILWQIVGAIFGIALGFVLSYLFVNASNEVPVAVTLTMFAAFFSFYIGHVHTYQAGVVTTIVTGVMLSPTKLRSSSDVETQLTIYWEWLSFVFNTLAFVIPGFIVGLKPKYINMKHVFHVLMVYIFCCCTRLLLFVLSRPLLLKMGHNLTRKNIAIVVVGPYRAAPSLIIAMLYRKYSPEDGQQVLTYAATLSFLSTLINGFLLPYLLKVLGMYELTHARALNMRNTLEKVHESRIKAMESLKMDRVIADANWIAVENATKLSNSELKQLRKGENVISNELESRKNTFHDTDLESINPTKKELIDLELEVKHRILKSYLVSLWRQYEAGTLSKSSIRILSNLLLNAMEKDDPRLDVNDLELYWSAPRYIQKIKFILQFIVRSLPQKYDISYLPKMRAALLRIANTLAYKIVSTCLVILDTYLIFNLGVLFNWTTITIVSPTVLQAFDFVFYSIFMIEFFLLVFALGCIKYFKRQFHKIDFTCNVLIRTTEICMVIANLVKTGEIADFSEKDLFILNYIKFLLVIRLNRLYTIVEVIVSRIFLIMEDLLDNTLVQYYEIGKAFLVANDMTLKHLRHIVQDREIYSKIKKLLEDDRRKVAKSLGLMQKERPNVGVTTKTRHAVIQVINGMNECINDIYDEGLLDDIEKKYLKESLEQAKRLLRTLKVVTPGSPEYILKDIPWLFEENETASFLLEHAKLVSYSYQDIIIDTEEEPFGLFVMVSGLAKWVYKPSHSTIENFKRYGALPNCDFLNSLKVEDTHEDYIVCGNVIGEIGAVTGRSFDMTVVCESEVQVYFISRLCMFKVLYQMDHCFSVYSKVWKTIGIRIALILFQYVPNFQGWQREKTLLYLEKSFVPTFNEDVETLYIKDIVADVILIEGRIMDGLSRSVYYAPFYIPRTAYKLILPGTSKWNVDPVFPTRLLIIPSKHVDETDVMGPEGILKEGKEPVGLQLHSSETSLILPQFRRSLN